MKYDLIYLPSAQQDMIDIVTYISRELENPAAANRLAEKFINEAENIRSFPYSTPAYYPIRPLKHDYRKLLVDSYIVFYWVDETEHRIVIARVIYAKSDYNKMLK